MLHHPRTAFRAITSIPAYQDWWMTTDSRADLIDRVTHLLNAGTPPSAIAAWACAYIPDHGPGRTPNGVVTFADLVTFEPADDETHHQWLARITPHLPDSSTISPEVGVAQQMVAAYAAGADPHDRAVWEAFATHSVLPPQIVISPALLTALVHFADLERVEIFAQHPVLRDALHWHTRPGRQGEHPFAPDPFFDHLRTLITKARSPYVFAESRGLLLDDDFLDNILRNPNATVDLVDCYLTGSEAAPQVPWTPDIASGVLEHCERACVSPEVRRRAAVMLLECQGYHVTGFGEVMKNLTREQVTSDIDPALLEKETKRFARMSSNPDLVGALDYTLAQAASEHSPLPDHLREFCRRKAVELGQAA